MMCAEMLDAITNNFREPTQVARKTRHMSANYCFIGKSERIYDLLSIPQSTRREG